MGVYAPFACLLLVFSIVMLTISMMLFGYQHRIWTEHAISPALTLRELSERMSSLALRQKVNRNTTWIFAQWNRKLEAASVQLRDQSRWAAPRMWQLGQAPAKISAIMIVLALFTWIGALFRESPSTHMIQITLHYTLFMLVSMPMMLIAMQCYGRRETLSRDLLHPIEREQWIRAVFVGVMMQVGALMVLALIITNVQIFILSGTPAISSVLRGCAAVAGQTVLVTGVVLYVTVHRGFGLVAIIGLIGFIASGVVSLIVVDTGIGPSAAAAAQVREFLHHPAVLPSLWVVAGFTLVLAYTQWQRTEFARV